MIRKNCTAIGILIKVSKVPINYLDIKCFQDSRKLFNVSIVTKIPVLTRYLYYSSDICLTVLLQQRDEEQAVALVQIIPAEIQVCDSG
jgi:hypothetical protein